MDKRIRSKVDNWLEGPYDEDSKNEIQNLLDEGREDELIDRFYKDLEFGTGGLRGVVGAGTNRINIYNVRKVTQALANYVLKNTPAEKKPLAVITFDCRKYSDVFADEAARVFAANKIRCYLTQSLRPTPFLSFCVRQLQADAGIVITASHNPPQYNGYKVYGNDGGQIVPPVDGAIIEEVRSIDDMDAVKTKPFKEAVDQGLIIYTPPILEENFLQSCQDHLISPELFQGNHPDIKLVYTSLHGTGITLVPALLQKLNLKNCFIVSEQEKPDGNFPTVDSPNPEEAASLKLALELAREKKAALVMATDPDGDRVGIAYPDKNGVYILPTGNQIAVLLCHYILSRSADKGKDLSRGYIVKTIVTTRLLEKVAQHYGVKIFNVLTGFKWIGKIIRENEGKGEYLFGGEESYGYLIGDYCRDKDAVGVCGLLAEMALYLSQKNMTFDEYLDAIYERFGYFLESLQSLTLKGQKGEQTIRMLMKNMKNSPPKTMLGSPLKTMIDVEKGVVINMNNGQVQERLDLPSSPVLGLCYENDTEILLRPSGTEPKIKFYFSINIPVTQGRSINDIKTKGSEQMQLLKSEFMELVENIIKEH